MTRGNVRQMQPELPRHRKLTGIAPWPMIVLAGPEKVGKTWSAVEACMTELAAGGYWFPCGENDPDEYALIPGFDDDRFTLVQNDGTYRDLLNSLLEELKREEDSTDPTVWVLDSGTRTWDLLSGMAQREMYDRMRKRAEDAARKGRPVLPPDPEQKPAVDLWNTAADRWSHIIDALRKHRGPVVITCRMEQKTVMDAGGNPTKEKENKILSHKSLPSDADVIVELSAPGQAVVTGLRSVKLAGIGKRVEFKDFTVDALLRSLGVVQGGPRTHSGIDPDDKPAAEADVARAELRAWCAETQTDREAAAAEFADANGGLTVKDATAGEIRAFLASKQAEPAKVAS